MTDHPCLEVPFDVVTKWEEIEGSCARFYAAAEWGYKQALATSPPEDNTKPGFINVCVEGPPPAPYENWEDWLVCTFKNRTIQRVYIRALISGDFSFDKKEVATPPPEVPSEKEIEQFVESIRMPWIIEHLSRATDPDPDFDVVIVRAALERWGR